MAFGHPKACVYNVDTYKVYFVIIKDAKCLILGLTFKENCSDVRNTKVLDIFHYLDERLQKVDISDPRASKKDIIRVYNKSPIEIKKIDLVNYEVVIIAVNHQEYQMLYDGKWISSKQIVFDVKGIIDSDSVLSL